MIVNGEENESEAERETQRTHDYEFDGFVFQENKNQLLQNLIKLIKYWVISLARKQKKSKTIK